MDQLAPRLHAQLTTHLTSETDPLLEETRPASLEDLAVYLDRWLRQDPERTRVNVCRAYTRESPDVPVATLVQLRRNHTDGSWSTLDFDLR